MSNDLLQTSRNPMRTRGTLLLLVIVIATGLSGCNIASGIRDYVTYNTPTEDFVTGWRDGVWARRAYNARRPQLDPGRYEADFKAGFIAGYRNVAQGGEGCTPSLPPRVYWSWRYQSAEGQAKVNAWFSGFPHGARAGEEDGIGNYYQIQVASWLEDGSRSECPDCLNGKTWEDEGMPPTDEQGGLYFEEVIPQEGELPLNPESGVPSDSAPSDFIPGGTTPDGSLQPGNPGLPPEISNPGAGTSGAALDSDDESKTANALLNYLDNTFREPTVRPVSYREETSVPASTSEGTQQRLPPVDTTASRPAQPAAPAASRRINDLMGPVEEQRSTSNDADNPLRSSTSMIERLPAVTSPAENESQTEQQALRSQTPQPSPVAFPSPSRRGQLSGADAPVVHDSTRITEGWPRVSLFR